MIVEKQEVIEVRGSQPLKLGKVKIAEESQAMFIQAMSDSIYKDKPGSMVRETVTNAWDANAAANSDKPVIIKVTEQQLVIKDFGLGLSPKQMVEVWQNLGTSTKRGGNGQHGGWGIGSKTPLAYTNEFTIKTIADGKGYIYMVKKTDNLPDVALHAEFEPEEGEVGTEIIVGIINGTRNDIQNAIKNQLLYFDNLYVEGVPGWNNDYKLLVRDNFIVNRGYPTHRVNICLGQVAYPFPQEYVDEYNRLDDRRGSLTESLCLGLKFEIGELPVIFSREAINLSNDVKQILFDKLDAVQDELLVEYKRTAEVGEMSLLEYMFKEKTSSFKTIFDIRFDVTCFKNCLEFVESVKGFEDFTPMHKTTLLDSFSRHSILNDTDRLTLNDKLYSSNSVDYRDRNVSCHDVIRLAGPSPKVVIYKTNKPVMKKTLMYAAQVVLHQSSLIVFKYDRPQSVDERADFYCPKEYIDQFEKEVFGKIQEDQILDELVVPSDFKITKRPNDFIKLTLIRSSNYGNQNYSYKEFVTGSMGRKSKYILLPYANRDQADELVKSFDIPVVLAKQDAYQELLLDSCFMDMGSYMKTRFFRKAATTYFINSRYCNFSPNTFNESKENERTVLLPHENNELTLMDEVRKSDTAEKIIDYIEATNYNFFHTEVIDVYKKVSNLTLSEIVGKMASVKNAGYGLFHAKTLLMYKVKGINKYLIKTLKPQ